MRTVGATPTIRELKPADVDAIVALAGVLGGPESVAEWKRRLRRGSGVVTVGAAEDGRLVGYAAGEVRAIVGLTPTAWVEAFGVDNAWRGRGLGRVIASALLQRFRELGAARVLTLLPLHDRTLTPFFRELGFREEPLVAFGRSL